MLIKLQNPLNLKTQEYKLVKLIHSNNTAQLWIVRRTDDNKKFNRWINKSELSGNTVAV